MWELPKLAAEFGPFAFIVVSFMVLIISVIFFMLRLHGKQMETLHANHLSERKTWRDDLSGILARHERERTIDRREQKAQAEKVVEKLSTVLIEISKK